MHVRKLFILNECLIYVLSANHDHFNNWIKISLKLIMCGTYDHFLSTFTAKLNKKIQVELD